MYDNLRRTNRAFYPGFGLVSHTLKEPKYISKSHGNALLCSLVRNVCGIFSLPGHASHGDDRPRLPPELITSKSLHSRLQLVGFVEEGNMWTSVTTRYTPGKVQLRQVKKGGWQVTFHGERAHGVFFSCTR